MIVISIFIQVAVIAAVLFLIFTQIYIQFREYRFYKGRGWDFSVESKLDYMKIDKAMKGFEFRLTSWQRFYLFRPYCILFLSLFFGFMMYSVLA